MSTETVPAPPAGTPIGVAIVHHPSDTAGLASLRYGFTINDELEDAS